MTPEKRTAPELRVAITTIYTAPEPPPGVERANALLFLLRREPNNPKHQIRARDLLAVVALRSRLVAYRERAEWAGAHNLALVVHGLVGHADAERPRMASCGARPSGARRRHREPGYRSSRPRDRAATVRARSRARRRRDGR